MSLATITISSMVGFRIVNISNIMKVNNINVLPIKVQINPFPMKFKLIS